MIDQKAELVSYLHTHQAVDGGWPYYPSGPAYIEPTCWAVLSLAGSQALGDVERGKAITWLKGVLRKGQLETAITGNDGIQPWELALASLCISLECSHLPLVCQLTKRLLEARVSIAGRNPKHVTRHDTSLEGWPWTAGTFPWVEPTCYAVLALRAYGCAGDREIQAGIKLIQNRSIPGGGWNHGNNVAFGKPLMPDPQVTGVATDTLWEEQGSSVEGETLAMVRKWVTDRVAPLSWSWCLIAARLHNLVSEQQYSGYKWCPSSGQTWTPRILESAMMLIAIAPFHYLTRIFGITPRTSS